ncbi:Respiratory-chain NADH dehydrogenase domain 51 kDa subunit [Desulfatibacillum aliphaticivorans]|uniref:Respiratory-chain NADH dehydrogenase domain 51 kDa subunit n=1 Tax=Desulfatibacillum aliphaticivorans TaxID=218208 RepID=B8FDM6_DESAL|nr:4Fe-4S dicluster domain-containing protein [Desulfatibacillum aliphaticivorans]ACL06657.1 Respiratory-chain NADH dehydrogenase domain 51 kDa subunit [Desulfatibacillum aliphaticivorans]
MTHPLVEKTRAAGVVGAGGAGFPTHVKIDAKADTVLINGASCEPLLCSDIHLMETRSDDIIKGLGLVMDAVGAEKGMIGIKAKHQNAVAILEQKVADAGLTGGRNISVFKMKDFYPGGDEHVLVNEATGRIVPQGGIPLEVGVVVSNSESVFNMSQAMEDKPVTHRTLNVAGEVMKPIVVRVPVGTPVSHVLKLAGGVRRPDGKVIDGGPMMGRVLDDPEKAFVTKTTSGLIVLPAEHNVIRGKVTDINQLMRVTRLACCQCSLCTDLCPRFQLGHNLHPHLIMRSLALPVDHPIKQQALLCSECGICEKWACPMQISPREVNRAIKQQLKIRPKDVGGEDLGRHPYTDYRRVPVKRLLGKLDLLAYDVHPEPVIDPAQPGVVGLYLRQHIGAPSTPVVSVGDAVACGQVVAEIPEKALGARIHASISGKVIAVDSEKILVKKENGNV